MKHKALLLAAALMLAGAPVAWAKSSIWIAITDMYDQKSIKPQEQGSMTSFPLGSVDTRGNLMESPDGNTDWLLRELDPATSTPNPIPATPESLANGELKYNTYCAVCHTDSTETSEMGTAKSKVNEKGMLAPALLLMTPGFPDGYLYFKAKYASGAIMPPLGYATTDKDRWDIVNYIRNKLEKQQ
ncbi:MAG: cytochrome c [bacterium]|nr:cytochrome c [bacterium]